MSKVLIVEDDDDSRTALAEFLRRAGYEVNVARDGKEGLVSVIQTTPDLVIVDLLMPDMDGAGVLEVMRSYLRLQSLPVIIWTGLTDSPMLEHARFLKVNAIIAKGKATYDDILAAVQQELPRLPH